MPDRAPRPASPAPLAVLAALACAAALAGGCAYRVRAVSYGVPVTAAGGGGEVRAVYVAGARAGADARGGTHGRALATADLAYVPDGRAEIEAAGFASAPAGWAWSAEHGWTQRGAEALGAGAAGGGVTAVRVGTTTGGGGSSDTLAGSLEPAASGAWLWAPTAPRLAASSAVGGGARLSALVGRGVTVAGCACSSDGAVAALSLLVPLAPADLGSGALVLEESALRVEVAPEHEALGTSGGATALAIRVRGGAAPAIPPPLRVHLVVDASTSMRSRWDDVKDAALELLGRLRPEDELQLVVYGDAATVALPPAPVGDGRAARAVVRGLRCGGRTNIEAGLRAAYEAAVPDGGSIVLVLSDGVPLGGAATAEELGALAAEARRRAGTTTVAVGLGTEFHAGVLYALGTSGGGDFRIAPRAEELSALLAGALAAHGRIVARGLTVDLVLPPGVTLDPAATLDAGLVVEGARVRLAVPSVTAGSEVSYVVPVTAVGGTTLVASVEASWSASARTARSGLVRIALADAAIPAGGIGVALDVELGRALAAAASLVENGSAAEARALLDAHAARVEAVASHRAEPALLARVRAARAFGLELERLVPGAGHAERRATAAAILEWSIDLAR